MQYPDLWVFDFDQDTLGQSLTKPDYTIYTNKQSQQQISLSQFKNMTLVSQNELEIILQKHLIQQIQMLHNFFSTEAVCNEDDEFQIFSQKLVQYLESEMIYCKNFWKVYSNLSNFSINRLEASILRTLAILRELQFYVSKKYMIIKDDKSSLNPNIHDPHDGCLNEIIDDLVLDYDDLKTLIAFFEKGYGDLFNKLQVYQQQYEELIILIGKVYMTSKLFFSVHPRGMSYEVAKIIANDPEKSAKQRLFIQNNECRTQIKEAQRQKETEDPQMQAQRYFMNNFSNVTKSDVLKFMEKDFEKDFKKDRKKKLQEQYSENYDIYANIDESDSDEENSPNNKKKKKKQFVQDRFNKLQTNSQNNSNIGSPTSSTNDLDSLSSPSKVESMLHRGFDADSQALQHLASQNSISSSRVQNITNSLSSSRQKVKDYFDPNHGNDFNETKPQFSSFSDVLQKRIDNVANPNSISSLLVGQPISQSQQLRSSPQQQSRGNGYGVSNLGDGSSLKSSIISTHSNGGGGLSIYNKSNTGSILKHSSSLTKSDSFQISRTNSSQGSDVPSSKRIMFQNTQNDEIIQQSPTFTSPPQQYNQQTHFDFKEIPLTESLQYNVNSGGLSPESRQKTHSILKKRATSDQKKSASFAIEPSQSENKQNMNLHSGGSREFDSALEIQKQSSQSSDKQYRTLTSRPSVRFSDQNEVKMMSPANSRKQSNDVQEERVRQSSLKSSNVTIASDSTRTTATNSISSNSSDSSYLNNLANQNLDFHSFLNSKLTTDFLEDLNTVKTEPKKIVEINKESGGSSDQFQSYDDIDSYSPTRRKTSSKIRRRTQKSFKRSVAEEDNDLNHHRESEKQAPPPNRNFTRTVTMIKEAKKQEIEQKFEKSMKKSSIQFNPEDFTLDDEKDPNYTPYRENKGQDIADEKLMGHMFDDINNNDDSEFDLDEIDSDEELVLGNNMRNFYGTQVSQRFVNSIQKLNEMSLLPGTHYINTKYSVNVAPKGDEMSARNQHKWSVIQDQVKRAIVEKQIENIKDVEDPCMKIKFIDTVPRKLNFEMSRYLRKKKEDQRVSFDRIKKVGEFA